LRRTDSFIGRFSYPVYLCHIPAGALAAYWLFGEPVHGRSLSTVAVFIASMPIIAAISYVVIRLIDHPIDNIRRRKKKRLSDLAAASPP
jgi:peptidoglycan/LPS O-acetylase OafA/YrhL